MMIVHVIVCVRKFRSLKIIKKSPITTNKLRKLIAIFKETDSFHIKRGRRRNPFSAAEVEDVATALHEQTSSDAEISVARKIDQMLDMPNNS